MNVAAKALSIKEIEAIDMPSVAIDLQRFSFADINRHGPWLLPRMLTAYPELTEYSAVGWLKGFVTSNEFLFLAQPHAVCLFQLMPGYTLIPAQVVQERFVWVENPKDDEQVLHAAHFYSEAYKWSTRMTGIETIIVDENTDVPKGLIEEQMVEGHKCRLLRREMTYVRVKDR